MKQGSKSRKKFLKIRFWLNQKKKCFGLNFSLDPLERGRYSDLLKCLTALLCFQCLFGNRCGFIFLSLLFVKKRPGSKIVASVLIGAFLCTEFLGSGLGRVGFGWDVEKVQADEPVFSDLTGNSLYDPYIVHFTRQGFINGYEQGGKPTGKFGPHDELERSQMAKISASVRLAEERGIEEQWFSKSKQELAKTVLKALSPYLNCQGGACGKIGKFDFAIQVASGRLAQIVDYWNREGGADLKYADGILGTLYSRGLGSPKPNPQNSNRGNGIESISKEFNEDIFDQIYKQNKPTPI